MNMPLPMTHIVLRSLAALALVVALSCGAAQAQQPPDAPPPMPEGAGAPPPPPEEPATQPVQEQPAAPVTQKHAPAPVAAAPTPVLPPAATAKAIILNFRDASLDTVLNYLSETAGLAVVRETTVEGRITVTSRQPMTVDESITLLNTVLKEKGYAAVRMGRILKVVTLDEIRKRNVPVRTGNDPAAIEQTDEVITQVVPLRYIDAVKLKTDLAALVPATATLASNAAGNALILTDTSANIRRIVEIVQALDSHMAGAAEVRVFQLKFANATNAAKLISSVFKDDTSTQQQTGSTTGGRFFFGGFRGGPGGMTQNQTQTDDQARRAPKVTATADDRTNSVVVTGPSDSLRIIEGILKDLDSNPVEEQSVMVYALRNAQAKTLETVLNNLFGTTQTSRTGGTSSSQRFGQQTFGSTQVSSTSQQLANGLLGQVYVVANTDTNSLMVMTAPKNFAAVKMILTDLDRAIPQVLIKVLLAEVTHDDKSDIGVEFSVLNLAPFGRKTNLSTSLGVAAQTTSGNPNGLLYTLVDGDFTGILRALETVGKLDVLSRPYILASDNQLATINVGQQIPLITNTRTTDTGNTINTIQYQKFGIILKVTPHVNPDGLVIMDVNPSITTMTGQTVPISEVVSAPVFAERSAQSRIAIRDGQTIVIGGMIEDRKTDTISKVPYLGSIPLIGRLFQRTITQKSKTELLIFLTPLVARNGAELKEMSNHEEGSAKLVPKAIDESAYKEHMKGLKKDESAPAPQSAPAPDTIVTPPAAPAPESTPAAPLAPPESAAEGKK